MISRQELRKRRCYNGAFGNRLRLMKFTPEDVIINSFVTTNNPNAQHMANLYEKMLALCTIDFDKYANQRDSMQLDVSNYIHEHKLYREWADFAYVANEYIQNRDIADAYMSEIMETWNYLTNYEPVNIYGITRQNELLVGPELHGDWDVEMHKLMMAYEKGHNKSEKYKQKLTELYDKNFLIERDENITDICIFNMIPFINERTKVIYPKSWFIHGKYGQTAPRKWKDTSFYKEQLRKRKFLIDKKGVKVYLKNAGSYSEVLFLEDVTKDNKIIMLFRLTSKMGGSTMGFYHLGEEKFFSAFKYTDGKKIHNDIENFILELYTEIVCGLEKDKKRLYALKEVEDIEHIEDYKESHVYIQFQAYNEHSDKDELQGKRKSGYNVKPHERRFSIRKLNGNRKASEEAIERALEYGIELQEGYTFVRSYEVGNALKDIRHSLE